MPFGVFYPCAVTVPNPACTSCARKGWESQPLNPPRPTTLESLADAGHTGPGAKGACKRKKKLLWCQGLHPRQRGREYGLAATGARAGAWEADGPQGRIPAARWAWSPG